MSKSSQKKKAGPGSWKYTVGLKPHTVTAFERKDKDNVVWLRWSRSGTGLFDKKSLGCRIRDDAGRLDEEQVKLVQAAARKAYDRLIKGEDPRSPERDATAGPLTIASGLKRALTVPGLYAVQNEHWRDMSRYAKHILEFLPDGVHTWADLTPVKYQTLWQLLAHWRVKLAERTRHGEIEGKRATELAIVLLSQVGRWLAEDGQLPHEPKMPKKKWREAFEADWARITGDRPVTRDGLRHSEEELGRLFRGVDAGLGDPRICLAVRTAGEARLGQALRCDRLALDLGPSGAFGLGRFTIPDTGKKKGATIDLTPELRGSWDAALAPNGYLGDLEAAFRAKRLRTYALFPAGRLRNGKSPVTSTEPIGKRAALDLFHDLELASGVPVIEGRGWYGVRRISIDLAEDMEKDGRVLNAITGHQSDETRRKVYQKKLRDVILAKAAETRTSVRQLVVQLAEQNGSVLLESAEGSKSKWEEAREAKRLRRREQHTKVGARQRPTYPKKSCTGCGSDFVPSGPNTKKCPNCSPRRVRPDASARAANEGATAVPMATDASDRPPAKRVDQPTP